MTSTRLLDTLYACSTTPRTALRRVEELRKCTDFFEPLYAEAKLALVQGDVETALALFLEVPVGYRNADRYVEQCHTYARLCASGVIQRPHTDALRVAIGRILNESPSDTCVSRYAEGLYAKGYRTLEEIHPEWMDDECLLLMKPMHRKAVVAHVTGLHSRVRSVMGCLQACLPAAPRLDEGAMASVGLDEATRRRIDAGEGCLFWLLRADCVKCMDRLWTMNEIRARHPEWLVARFVAHGEHHEDVLAVSHRWETPSKADPEGAQLRALMQHLAPEIAYVWIDVCCMPQGAHRTPLELFEFATMLKQVNLLYLECRVLAIVDGSYTSRFWTLLESWLAMQCVTPYGFHVDDRATPRCEVACIHNAAKECEGAKLKTMWSKASLFEAHAVLSRNDVHVTNQSDKSTQLAKLLRLDGAVRHWAARMC